MLNISLRIAGHTLAWLRRSIVALVLLLALASAALILVLRYSVLPNIEHYHTDITDAVSKAVGHVVEIEKIDADWRGMKPHLQLSGIRILDKQKRTSLALQKVDVVVSWMTLLKAELRLASLEIDQPDLMIKRNVEGNIEISGVQFESGSTDNNFADFVLNQKRIVVRGAHISWLDEKQAKPLLVFDDVNLLIENGWNYHRFALRGLPPAELSTQLDVRGELYGKSIDDLQGWSGEIFTQLDYADLAAWKTWLPLPRHIKQGRGAVRGWLKVDDGKINQITADLALVNVQTRLADDLPPLDIRVLSGRMAWRDVAQGFEVALNRFSLKLFNDFVLKPTDVFVRMEDVAQTKAFSGELRANLLELEGLGKLMEYLPLEPTFKKRFVEFAPQGRVENIRALWQGGNDKKLRYKIKGKFVELSLHQVGELPGFSGLSGEVDGNEIQGSLSVNSRKLTVDAPQFMPEKLVFETISAQSSWQSNSKGIEIKLRNFAVTNEDIAGVAYGNFQTLANSPGRIDLNVHLTRASLPHAGKYIPLIALEKKTKEWLTSALLEGQSNDFNLRIQGDINDFPFADNRKGVFKLHARVNGVVLEYAPDWPRINKANAELLINGKELSVSATSAKTAGLQLQNIRVVLPDMLSNNLMLKISGEATGENARALEFVQTSPVRGYLDGFTDSISAKGNGRLSLKLDIPLQGEQAVKVSGTYHFKDSEVIIDKRLPTLRKVNGDLQFTESGVSTNNISTQILGGPARLQIQNSDGGKMNVKLAGLANFTALHEINPQPLLRKLSGESAWNAEIVVQNKLSKVLITSSLLGLQSDLPAPLAKKAVDSMPLRVEMIESSAERRMLTVQYGQLLNANLLQRKNADNLWMLDRGLINFGNVVHKADRKGLWVIGTLPPISLEGWGWLAGVWGESSDSATINIAGADFSIQKITGYGNLVHDLHVKATTRKNILSAQFASKEVNGALSWQDAGMQSDESGRLQVQLKNLDLGLDDNKDGASQPEITSDLKKSGTIELPEIDLTIDRLSYKGRQLGMLELQLQPDEQDYQINRLRLSNSDGVLNVNGKWMQSEDGAETSLNLKYDIANAGNTLARVGYPGTVKNGSGKIEGSLAWAGAPWAYSKAGLNGNLSLDTSKGQFLQIDPGMGKLLSILSLQALPKRIALDFEDVFSKGFEFDSIKGSADIKDGVMHTDNLKIEGSSAKVFMAGQIDLAHEKQNLRVRIVPSVGNSAALISALVVTPVVGAGVYIASKILGDPLGQLVSFEYNISGSWVDPKVEKIDKKKHPEPEPVQ